MVNKSASKIISEDVIRFLDRHLLDPNPANYAFGFLYMTEGQGLIGKLVNSITDGGVRLTQSEVDDMMCKTFSEGVEERSDPLAALQEQLHHRALAFADLTSAALSDATGFNQQLTEGMEQIATGFDLAAVIRAMREKTAEVERKLAETKNETEKLRVELGTARNDASRDALTGLPNRRWMEAQMRDMLAMSGVITVAFCDIDHFKLINDRFGHAVGDRVLKAVAEVLQQELTPHSVARFGGEEFVALFADLGQTEAFELVEQAREAAARKSYRVRDTDAPLGKVTFSAGIASTSRDVDKVLKDADSAMYEAKKMGRDCTVCYGAKVDGAT